MAKFELRLKLGRDAELDISFDDEAELADKLASLNLDNISALVQSKAGMFAPREPRQPKPGLEQIYRFASNGLVELIKSPKNEPETVGLVLYAYHPEAASIENISASSGVRAVSQKYLSHKGYSAYFERKGRGMYALSQKGIAWVTSKILPDLLSAKEVR
jgi:hypothetical protein